MSSLSSRKQPKTLSGIETRPPAHRRQPGAQRRRKQPKTLSGIETDTFLNIGKFNKAENNLKPYQGLKPIVVQQFAHSDRAENNLKPYQGLKRGKQLQFGVDRLAENNLKPYQGLKLSLWEKAKSTNSPKTT